MSLMTAPFAVLAAKPVAGSGRWSVGSRPPNGSTADMPNGQVQPRLALVVHASGVAPPTDLHAPSASDRPMRWRQQ